MIIVVGEALVDLLVDDAGGVKAVPGGGPLNAARTIARLGLPTTFVGRVSQDRLGALLATRATDDGVHLALPEPVGLATTLAIVGSNRDGDNSFWFHAAGTSAFAVTASDMEAMMERLAPTVDAPAVDRVVGLHLGTLGLVIDPMAGAVERLLEIVGGNTVVLADPNCRPSAIADRSGYLARLGRILRRADVVKVSTEDLAYLYPGASRHDAAGRLLAAGPACVLLTDGAAPVRVFVDGSERRVPAPPTEVVDTVGAGDAFGASFLAWWTGHRKTRAQMSDAGEVGAAVEAAVVIAARTCTRAGAEPPVAAEVSDEVAWRWLAV